MSEKILVVFRDLHALNQFIKCLLGSVEFYLDLNHGMFLMFVIIKNVKRINTNSGIYMYPDHSLYNLEKKIIHSSIIKEWQSLIHTGL